MAGELASAFEAWKRTSRDAATALLRRTSDDLEGYLRTPGTPPWDDDSSEAREGLYVRSTPVRGVHGYWEWDVEMGYAVDYGYWLEVKSYGVTWGHVQRGEDRAVAERNRSRRQHTTDVLEDYFGVTQSQQAWGRDALLNPTMALLMPHLERALRELFDRPDYRPRFSGAQAVAYAGNNASVNSFRYRGPATYSDRGR